MLTILCGKSSSGKDTLSKVLKACGFQTLVSTTTRPMRVGEVEGRDYYFVTRNEFFAKIDAGDLLEHRDYNTRVNGVPDVWYYGLEKKALEGLDKNKGYVLVMDLDGARAVQNAYDGDCFTVYIDVDDKRRTEWAKARGSFDSEEWYRRLADDQKVFSPENVAEVCDVTIANDKEIFDLLGKFIEVYQRRFVK